jgi:hypothetical protein
MRITKLSKNIVIVIVVVLAIITLLYFYFMSFKEGISREDLDEAHKTKRITLMNKTVVYKITKLDIINYIRKKLSEGNPEFKYNVWSELKYLMTPRSIIVENRDGETYFKLSHISSSSEKKHNNDQFYKDQLEVVYGIFLIADTSLDANASTIDKVKTVNLYIDEINELLNITLTDIIEFKKQQ